MQYFNGINTIEQLRSQFRTHCLKLHPDKGGLQADFVAMTNEYDILSADFCAEESAHSTRTGHAARYTTATERAFREKLEKILNIRGLTVEITGSWLWVYDCYSVYQQVKALGFKFSSAKKAWYWGSGMLEGKCRGRYTMQKIRARFGSTILTSSATKIPELEAAL